MSKFTKILNLQEPRSHQPFKNVLIFLFICLIFGSFSTRAANHYIRAGSTGDGSNWSQALGQLPEILIRGDTYYIADGTYPGYTFDDPESGDLYITIKKATLDDHGTDVGWQDSYGDGQAIFVSDVSPVLLFTSSSWIIDGQVGGGPGAWQTGHGFKITSSNNANSHILVSLGQPWEDNQPDNITISHTAFEYATNCFGSVNYGIYAMLSNDRVGEGNGPQLITLSHCYFHHVQKPIKTQHCRYWTIEYSCFYHNWANPVGSNQGEGWEDFGSDYITIRNSIFRDITGTGNIALKKNFCDNNEGWEIYGNVFYVSAGNPFNVSTGEGVIVDTVNCSTSSYTKNIKIFNNSFVNIQCNYAGAGIVFHEDAGGNEAYNNLWYSCAKPAQFVGVINNYNTLIHTEYAWNSVPGSDDVYISDDIDPFENWQEHNFQLKEGFIDRVGPGKHLSSSYNRDLFGTIRGTDGLWDRGAIEYVSSKTTDQSPTASITSPAQGEVFTYENRVITFDGSGSYDYDGTVVQWTWTDSLGNTIPDGAIVTASLSSGTHTITLTVTDNSGLTDTDTVTITVLNSQEASQASESSLSAQWKLVENSGRVAMDSSGNDYHGTCIGSPIWTGDQGLELSGTQYVEVADDNAFELTGPKTLCAWIKITAYTSWAKVLIKPHTAFESPWEMYAIDLGLNGNTPRFQVSNGIAGGLTAVAANSNTTLNLNQWYHLVGTYDGSQIALYLNGILVATAPVNFAIGTNTMPLCLGGRLGNNTLNGNLSDVRIYSGVLSAAQIQTLYTQGRALNPQTNLTGLWRLNDYGRMTTADASGNGYTATLIENPEWGRSWADEDYLFFTNRNQALQIPSGGLTPQAGTVAFWAAPSSEIGARYLLGHNYNGANRIALLTVNKKLAVSMGDTSLIQQDIAELPYGQMVHLALTWNNGQYTVYVDGEQRAAGTYSGLNQLRSTFDIGNYGDPALRIVGFLGLIDEVRTYNRALAADEVRNLYQTYHVKENRQLAFQVQATDGNGTPVVYNASNLPEGAHFDKKTQTFIWRPWYKQAGEYNILFDADGHPSETVTVTVQEVDLQDWYQVLLQSAGLL